MLIRHPKAVGVQTIMLKHPSKHKKKRTPIKPIYRINLYPISSQSWWLEELGLYLQENINIICAILSICHFLLPFTVIAVSPADFASATGESNVAFPQTTNLPTSNLHRTHARTHTHARARAHERTHTHPPSLSRPSSPAAHVPRYLFWPCFRFLLFVFVFVFVFCFLLACLFAFKNPRFSHFSFLLLITLFDLPFQNNM